MDNENNNEMSFHDMIMNIKKIDRIVIVDDVRTLTDEEMAKIRKQIKDEKNSGEDSEDNSEE